MKIVKAVNLKKYFVTENYEVHAQAQHAHHDEQQRLHPEQIGEQTADQRGGRADGKPDGGHIKGTTLQHQKADRGNEPEKWGGVHGQFPPYGPIIGHPLGGRSRVFY